MHNIPMMMKAGLLLAAMLVFMTATSTVAASSDIVKVEKDGLVVKSLMPWSDHACKGTSIYKHDKLVADWTEMAKGSSKDTVFELEIRLTIANGQKQPDGSSLYQSKPLYKRNLKASKATTFEVEYDNSKTNKGALLIDGGAFDLPAKWVNLSFYVGKKDRSKKAYVEAPVVECFIPGLQDGPGRLRDRKL